MASEDEPAYGRRLLVNVVDETAVAEPSRPFAYAPLSSKPEDGWEPITFRQVANAVNHVARLVADTVKADSKDGEPFPTLAYVGPSDIRYGIVMLACIKAGRKALFVSPRNSTEGQLSLFERTRCDHLWYAESFESLVQPWVGQRPMKATVVPAAEEWLNSNPEPFPYSRTFEDARWDPMAVLHTSGSTGIPKPIVVRQGSLAIADGQRTLPEYHGCDILWKHWEKNATRMFMPMPLFHAAGLKAGFILAVYYRIPIALGMPNLPLTPDLALKCLTHSGTDAAFLPPSLIEELSRSFEGVKALRNLKFLTFGGGRLSESVGNALAQQGVTLNNVIASTELMPYAIYYQKRQDLWQYFIINSDVMGADWRCVDPDEGIYELFVRRKNPRDPAGQPLFYTFPELDEWSTGDLYKPHPSLPDHWIYHGRGDDVIVFSTGEKLNPVTIEGTVAGHPAIKGALVVGQNRFQPGLILEPHVAPKDDAEAKALIDDVWPLVQEANKASVAHGRITRRLITLSDPNLPFQRAGKGTIQRGVTLKAYKSAIDVLYEHADDPDAQESVPLDFGSEEALTQSIVALFATNVGARDVQSDTDFFSVGVDSQQVMSVSNILRSSAKSAGVSISRDALAPRVIYANPTPRSLAAHLLAEAQGDGSGSGEVAREIEKTKSLVEKYTKDLPAPASADKPDPLDEGQTVLLTGSTGSLGAYLLDGLCTSAHVKRVIAMNRGADGGASRQGSISAARGLGTDFSKVEFVGVDLSLPDLGLGPAKYAELLTSADRIIHNAWPVNFNISVASFEPHIRGVRRLVDFASAAAKRVSIIFISSVSTAAAWTSPDPVPERSLDDMAMAEMGYGRSKMAGSMILDAAAARSGVPAASVRVGQVAGPRGLKGMWNKQEYLPSLIASSVYLGVLPDSLGSGGVVDWTPVEDIAGLVLDVSGVTVRQPISAISGYFHGVNPAKTTWGVLAPVLAQYYQGRIRKLVGMGEWVDALRASESASADVDKNPAIKLLDTYEAMYQASEAGQGHVDFDMTRTVSHSPTAANLSAVTVDLVKNWCAQWNF
ncbi:male sterility protein [Hirsutella rhossiliensis]